MADIQGLEAPIPWSRIIGSVIALITLVSLYIIQNPVLKITLYLIGALVGGWFFYIESVETFLKKKKISIDMLMTLAIIGSAYLGALEESLTIVFLYSITETLESYSKERTRSTIKSLMKLVPRTATRLVNDTTEDIEIEKIAVGDILLIRPGDHIPVDGEVIEGTARIDESTITGESVPVMKKISDQVYAGTLSYDGAVKIKAVKKLEESTISKIVRLVEDAQEKKTPTQLLVAKFTRRYNPFIIVMVILVFVIPVILGEDTGKQLKVVITLIVASAPCALAIATPVSVSAALGTAGKRGILVKGGVYLQTLGEVEAIAFDKTGTLTFGTPDLSSVLLNSHLTRDECIEIAGNLERNSNHPIARAIVDEFQERKLEKREVTDFSVDPEGGISGEIEGKRYYIGSRRFVKKYLKNIDILKEEQNTEIYTFLFTPDTLLATFTFIDQVKEDSIHAISKLKEEGISVFMITGDRREVALSISTELGIPPEKVYAEMTPEMKMDTIGKLKEEYKLAMVGDGVNDAPALALSDVGIAIGTAGTDVALETADIAIMGDNLENLVDAIKYGRKMKRIIFQNIIVSALILSGLIVSVLLGVIDLFTTILVHEGTEVVIVGNAFRLLAGSEFKKAN